MPGESAHPRHVAEWTRNILGTVGQEGRKTFNETLVRLIEEPTVPQAVKAAWNQSVDQIIVTGSSKSR